MPAVFHLRCAVGLGFGRSGRRFVALTAAVLAAEFVSVGAAETSVGDTQPREIQSAPLLHRSGPRERTLFTEMHPQQTGIVAENRYEDPAMWRERFADFEAGSIGTGVAIGDFDGDGRPDVFLVSKTESSRLFRNLGDWRFEDVTDSAGVLDVGPNASVWKTGATFVDVNNDGWLDLYVCRTGAPNLLYINQGDGSFREEAAQRGLAVVDASVMAAFCDYDRDGALDLFLQTNQPESASQRYPQKNYLFHNDGTGHFVEVGERAGVAVKGQGHAAMWWDFDGDGWPDLYVGNDFTPVDKLFHNNRDGSFTEVSEQVLPRVPFSSMGMDLADVDNDGRLDLFVADMAATTHEKDQRTMASARQLLPVVTGREKQVPSVMRNALFLNTGVGRALEVAQLAGLASTDWTWSVRFEDFDNDGWVDLFVTNGMYREPHNTDLMERVAKADTIDEKIRLVRASPMLVERHLAFRNRDDLRFEDVSAGWGLDQKGVSFGVATADLDGDGDLDLVVSNYKSGPSVYRNDSDSGHRITVALRGSASNRFGVGARVTVETALGKQVRQLVLSRGYLSSSEPVCHFGLGDAEHIQKLTVSWPSGYVQTFENLDVDRRYTVTEPTALGAVPRTEFAGENFEPRRRETLFRETPTEGSLEAAAKAGRNHDSSEALIARLPPALQNELTSFAAVQADVDGDGRFDLVAAGPWSEPKYFHGNQEGLAPSKLEGFETAGKGWWSAIAVGDFNGDGRPDFALGNAGLNTVYQPDTRHPVIALVGDFRGDRSVQTIEAYFEGERLVPRASRKELSQIIPELLKRFPRNDLYARAALNDLIGSEKIASAKRLEATQLSSGILLSQADGRYRFEPFPRIAQVAPITHLVVGDFDGDGELDLFAAQNGPTPSPLRVRFEGGIGQLLLGDGRGGFRAVPASESGLVIPAESRKVSALDLDGDGRLDIVVQLDDDSVRVFHNCAAPVHATTKRP